MLLIFIFAKGDQSLPFRVFIACDLEGSDIVIRGSGSNPASRQRAMAIQAVLIQLTLSIFEDNLELS